MAVRLHNMMSEYQGRVRVRPRAFPLELHGEAAPRDILEQEWWLAAIQEPSATFARMPTDWPTTTLPAFDAAWCAAQQGEAAGLDYDLRVRRAFFGEGRNIGKQSVLIEIAEEAGLDLPAFRQLLESDRPREAVLAEAHEGRERYNVRGTPTMMLPDGARLQPAIVFPNLSNRRVTGLKGTGCCGEECQEATREMFDQALQQGSGGASRS